MDGEYTKRLGCGGILTCWLLVFALGTEAHGADQICDQKLQRDYLMATGARHRRLEIGELHRIDALSSLSNPVPQLEIRAQIVGDALVFPNGVTVKIQGRQNTLFGGVKSVVVAVPYGEIFTDQSRRYTIPQEAKKMLEENPRRLRQFVYAAGKPGKRDFAVLPDGRFVRLDANHRSLAQALLHVKETHSFPAGKSFEDFFQVIKNHYEPKEQLGAFPPAFKESWISEAYETMMAAPIRFELKVDGDQVANTSTYFGGIMFTPGEALFGM